MAAANVERFHMFVPGFLDPPVSGLNRVFEGFAQSFAHAAPGSSVLTSPMKGCLSGWAGKDWNKRNTGTNW